MLTRAVLTAAWLILVYETAAVLFGVWPTVSAVARSHPVSAWVLVAALAALHVWAVAHLTGDN